MDEEIDQKVVLVTGGTQGIGLGIAHEFLSKNYYVIICARHEPKENIFENYEKSSMFIQCDISSSESRENLIETIKKNIGRIDVLVNNAGVAPPERKDILEASEEDFEYVIKINLQGPYFLTQQLVNFMIELRLKGNIENYHPSIITISSISAFTSSTSRGEYCISKAGLSMMTKLYADRLAEYDFPVYEIQPGIIKTPMTNGVKSKYDKLIREGILPIKRWGDPKDIGKAAVTLAEGLIPYATGQVLNLDGGFHIRRL
ncbi:3-ketoacyl-ACP reductase [Promethearchaeum syntrophicum]|uniref:3-ketoacyl-ACP reductase n=1 Tax=Promethearchaeum syntrophicum TaxID=2594042 RepID=A0A5B9DFH6_9ARCH|nr:3-ketoacyl-ACP reductase [Candidatus Prometheoarchaeum syntrophicum]QEE17486.1 3-ketoacyl-(acyl-carrier-protein) reductase [Candidatus Prometheoarchaeum syntrophicum]